MKTEVIEKLEKIIYGPRAVESFLQSSTHPRWGVWVVNKQEVEVEEGGYTFLHTYFHVSGHDGRKQYTVAFSHGWRGEMLKGETYLSFKGKTLCRVDPEREKEVLARLYSLAKMTA